MSDPRCPSTNSHQHLPSTAPKADSSFIRARCAGTCFFFRISPSACARRDYIAALFPTRPHACVQLKPGRRICSSYRRLFCSPSACSLGIIGCPASDDRFRKPHLREGCGQLAPCLQAALQLKSVLTPSRLAPDPSQKRALLSRQTIAEQLHLLGPRSLEMWAQLSYSHHWPA
ncbi:hypothetical protein L1887_57132 [Cichorium endivia]|nr:hypothetical protein L1887_57132 [Cichorium endivia]